eukprot:715512-Rhodomonas_salina.2
MLFQPLKPWSYDVNTTRPVTCSSCSPNSSNGLYSRTMEVAIIGGGPAGLIASKCLADEGFESVIFEQSKNVRSLAGHGLHWRAMVHGRQEERDVVLAACQHVEPHDLLLLLASQVCLHFAGSVASGGDADLCGGAAATMSSSFPAGSRLR